MGKKRTLKGEEGNQGPLARIGTSNNYRTGVCGHATGGRVWASCGSPSILRVAPTRWDGWGTVGWSTFARGPLRTWLIGGSGVGVEINGEVQI